MPLTPGTRLDPCEILAPIGTGGMGEVYKARDTRLDRTVAVKVERAVLRALRARSPRDCRSRNGRELFFRSGDARIMAAASMPRILALSIALAVAAGCSGSNSSTVTPSPSGPTLSFFVTSATSTTGNIGGLRGADNLCQTLAAAAGAGTKTWRAYLSAERDPDSGRAVDARSRIGNGPWTNAKGVVVATNLTELHARKGDTTVFVDEKGQPINGQWTGSPTPNEHDIMTGSAANGTLLTGFTCGDWTSSSATTFGQVGHADGLGPNGDTSGALSSWNSAHSNQNCASTAPRGGAGRIYCFATN